MDKQTNIKRTDIILMAPAGSFESLAAAIQAKADAVYFGVEHLNMRAHSATGFKTEDIPEVVKRCSAQRIKTYLTLNTVLYDKDITLMKKIVDAACCHQVSAVIASDMSVILYALEKKMPVHISTQVNISNYEAVKYYSGFADTMVLARELTLEQVTDITMKIKENKLTGPSGKPIRIELFVHGALCMAISGKCYLSLHESNYSANRGGCLQTCRKAYLVKEKESGYSLEIDNEYIMSPGDLKTIGFLDKILDAGVTVLKIEGRARSPEYVKTVTHCYHEALLSFCNGTYSEEKTKQWDTELKTVFNRGFWDGYYLGRKLGEWSDRYGSKATKKKIYIGKATNYFSKLRVAEFLIESELLNTGDNILIIGPTTGVAEATVSEIRVDMKVVSQANKGECCSIPLHIQIRRSDKIYKWVNATD